MTTKTNKLKRVTIEVIMSWKPCYKEAKLRELAGKRKSITALQILDLPIPADDKLWAVLRNDFFSDRELRLIACDFAESVLHIWEKQRANDSRPRDCIAVARRYANGEATDAERIAAWAAAWAAAGAAAGAAARDAARAAAWAAAWAAAGAAAWAAAGAAARDAARDAQIEIVRGYLKAQKESVI